MGIHMRATWLIRLFRLALPLVVLIAGGLLARYFLAHPPKARRQPPAPQARLVEVSAIGLGEQTVRLRAKGEVRPARELTLAAQVSGKVVEVSPRLTPGTRVRQGEWLARIEAEDYRIAVVQREAALAQARRDLAVEKGQSRVATREFELSGLQTDTESTALSRREPQLRAAEAAVASAEAALALALLNLERTEIRAPFNAVVLAKHAEVGSLLSVGGPVARLAGTDNAWVEALVPVDELPWVCLPDAEGKGGSLVRIEAHPGREGRVIRLLPELEPLGRLARLLVEFPEPFATEPGDPPLSWGSFLVLTIEGIPLEHAVALPRRWLREGETAYILTDENTLSIRPLRIARRGEDVVLVAAGLSAGERVVTTDLPVAVEGMALRTAPMETRP